MAVRRFQTLIFDLDDTLIPTSELLIPPAVRRVFEILHQGGLGWTFEDFEEYRKKHMKELSHRKIIENLIATHPLTRKGHILEHCLRAFYQSSLPEKVPLLPGAQESLEALATRYQLYILTAGDHLTQKLKLSRAGVENFFNEVGIADVKWSFNKKRLLESWIQEKKIRPDQSLSIGNRLKDEIQASKALGLSTCHFKYGEHAHEIPGHPLEHPDFTVLTHAELISICQL